MKHYLLLLLMAVCFGCGEKEKEKNFVIIGGWMRLPADEGFVTIKGMVLVGDTVFFTPESEIALYDYKTHTPLKVIRGMRLPIGDTIVDEAGTGKTVTIESDEGMGVYDTAMFVIDSAMEAGLTQFLIDEAKGTSCDTIYINDIPFNDDSAMAELFKAIKNF